MTQSAITSALNGKLSTSGGAVSGKITSNSIIQTPEIDLDTNGASIYQIENNGNIYFRYKTSKTNTDYAYTNLLSIITTLTAALRY